MVRTLRLLGIAALLGPAACGPSAAGDGTRVAATAYPLAFVAGAVAGGHAAVSDVVPPGADPHDVELSPRETVEVSEAADLVVYVGGGFQPAVERAVAEANVAALDVLDASGPPVGPEAGDPHVWLDPVALGDVARAVGERLAAIDPGHAGAYRRNARSLRRDLRRLHEDLAVGLAGCAGQIMVTGHRAFGHFARRYGLEEVPIAGSEPESEPSPRRIAEVVDLIRRQEVPVVFEERGGPAGIVATVAAEAGVETAVLDPLETEPPRGYFDGMRANLRALRDGLGCA